MPRGLSGAAKDQLKARERRPAYFVALALASGTVRAWNGAGSIVALGQTWAGVGEYGVIQGLESDRALRARSISIGINGVPGDAISGGSIAQARAERYQWRPLTVYLGFLELNREAILVPPVVVWSGYADVMAFRLGSSISVSLTAEHLTSALRFPNGLRATTESHNTRLGNPVPRDLFFEATDRLMGAPRPLPGQ
jgi:hypothetical protein